MRVYVDADGVWFDRAGPFDPTTLLMEVGQAVIGVARKDITEFEMTLNEVEEDPSGPEYVAA